MPLSADATAAVCETTCEHAVACTWEADMTMCESRCAAASPMFRGSGYAAWLDCITAADCAGGHPGELCYLQTAAEVGARSVHDSYVTECLAVPNNCPGTSVPSGVCEVEQVILFSDTYMTTVVLPCFEQPCDQISMCLETTVLDAF